LLPRNPCCKVYSSFFRSLQKGNACNRSNNRPAIGCLPRGAIGWTSDGCCGAMLSVQNCSNTTFRTLDRSLSNRKQWKRRAGQFGLPRRRRRGWLEWEHDRSNAAPPLPCSSPFIAPAHLKHNHGHRHGHGGVLDLRPF
jgi:hypothetical protein